MERFGAREPQGRSGRAPEEPFLRSWPLLGVAGEYLTALRPLRSGSIPSATTFSNGSGDAPPSWRIRQKKLPPPPDRVVGHKEGRRLQQSAPRPTCLVLETYQPSSLLHRPVQPPVLLQLP